MTIKRRADNRTPPLREHVYTLPVVRDLPARPPDPVAWQSLW
jgi:hypothetical protein